MLCQSCQLSIPFYFLSLSLPRCLSVCLSVVLPNYHLCPHSSHLPHSTFPFNLTSHRTPIRYYSLLFHPSLCLHINILPPPLLYLCSLCVSTIYIHCHGLTVSTVLHNHHFTHPPIVIPLPMYPLSLCPSHCLSFSSQHVSICTSLSARSTHWHANEPIVCIRPDASRGGIQPYTCGDTRHKRVTLAVNGQSEEGKIVESGD